MEQVLTIAGSDSGCGAGIQADIKSFAAAGTFGTSVITSITAQNTKSVADIFDLPLSIIESQIDAVFDDFDIKCVKTGMLSNTEIIELVVAKLNEYPVNNLVVDPVMVAKGGSRLLQKSAVSCIISELIPLATVITPNIEEAEFILNMTIDNESSMLKAAYKLLEMGSEYVLLKGGHLKNTEAVDVLVGENMEKRYALARIDTENTHGTGCTYASSIAAYLAKGYDIDRAVHISKRFVTGTIENSKNLGIGSGHGPLNHFYFSEGFDSAIR